MLSDSPRSNSKTTPRVCGMLVNAYYVRDPRVQRAAQAMRDAGWLVKVICLNEGGEAEFETLDGIQVIRCPMSRSKKRTRLRYILEYGNFMLRSFFRLWREDRKTKHDLVVVHNMPNALVFSTFLLRLRGCPVILDMHDAAPEVFASMFGIKSKLLGRIIRLEEKLAMKFSSGLITVNRGVEEVFVRRNPSAEFLLVHNSPSVEGLADCGIEKYDEGDTFRIVFHGHLHERNGVQRLIRVLPRLIASGLDIRFDVYGDGPYRETLDALCQHLDLKNRVTFHGRFRPQDLPDLLAGKHLGVALFFADELGDLLLPVKILEYTEAGVPVLSSKLATVEQYFSEDCVLYFDSEDELFERIREIHDNYEAALMRTDRARQIAASISWEHDSAQFVDFVESICNTQ